MKVFVSTSQTKNCAIRSDEICDDDDDFAAMSDSNVDWYVFIKQMTFTAVIQSISFRLSNDNLEKLQILISKLILK